MNKIERSVILLQHKSGFFNQRKDAQGMEGNLCGQTSFSCSNATHIKEQVANVQAERVEWVISGPCDQPLCG